MDIVSYPSIIYMILLYDTPHYDQPKSNSNKDVQIILRRAIRGLSLLSRLSKFALNSKNSPYLSII
jgi:hypothetical protein